MITRKPHRNDDSNERIKINRYVTLLLCLLPYSVSGQQQQESEEQQQQNHHHMYTDSFPKFDEYDHMILDPNTIYGSPYGGFSRSTRSKLASLPFYFPAYPDSTAINRNIVPEREEENNPKDTGDSSDTDTETNTSSSLEQVNQIDDSMFYHEIRDAEGRRFVCRVYHEDELEPESITSSMFDTAIPKKILLPTDSSSDGEEAGAGGLDNEVDDNVNTSNQDEEDGEGMDDKEDIDGETNENDNGPRSMVQGITNMKDSITTVSNIATRLKLLDGVCTQYHMGWWSYEWCHGKHVAQFHVEMAQKVNNAAKAGGAAGGDGSNDKKPSISIESITKIGYFADRQIEVIRDDKNDDATEGSQKQEVSSTGKIILPKEKNDKKKKKNSVDPHMDGTSMKKMGIVADSFEGGDICPDTNKPRRMDVVMQCCGLRNLNKQMKSGGILYNGKPVQSSIAAIVELKETQTCVYKAVICTPVLCEGSDKYYGRKFGLPIPDDHEGIIDRQQDIHRMDGGLGQQININGQNINIEANGGKVHINVDANGNIEVNGGNNIGKFLDNFVDSILQDVGGLDNNFKNQIASSLGKNSRGKWKEGESIRDTLERTLDRNSGCLTNASGGWWTYEFCYGRHVRQVHIDIKIDPVSGITTTSAIDDQYILGRYVDELDEYDDKDESQHVINPNKAANTNNSGGGGMGSSGPKNTGAATTSGRGNGAYFVQEYIDGDVCDDVDVTDAAVKAGSIVKRGDDGKIHRATTVRYFCGQSYELAKVNEDSTCHYVIDVLIPDLCNHPFFRAPIPKTNVVKCLPVDEN